MKKAYKVPTVELVAFSTEGLIAESQISINSGENDEKSDQDLTNDRDFGDSWDDFGE